MKTVIIGAGNVATVLGRLLKQNGHEILQVVSRDINHAQRLAEELGCDFTQINNGININADMYILAVSDSVLYNLARIIPVSNKLVVHTAGSVPIHIFKDFSSRYGVIYPLQSLRKEMKNNAVIPLLVNGNTDEVIAAVSAFATTLSSTVLTVSDEERLKLHVAGVVVSNFTNHLYALSEEFCEKENINFSILHPLIMETAQRIAAHHPRDVQTGPAIRNDIFTLDKHLRLLTNYPRLKYLYLKLTDSILNN